MSYMQFSKIAGISQTSLNRIELGKQHLTLDRLETLLKNLNARLSDVFPDHF